MKLSETVIMKKCERSIILYIFFVCRWRMKFEQFYIVEVIKKKTFIETFKIKIPRMKILLSKIALNCRHDDDDDDDEKFI